MINKISVRMPPDIQSVTVGGHQVVFIDDFLTEPELMLAAASGSKFLPCPGFDQKKGYPGIRATAPAEYSNALVELVDPLIKMNFQVPEHLDLRKSECEFSLTTVAPDGLGMMQRTPHFDSVSPHHMAVLLYLCGPEHGGTGFYRHVATGIQRVTPENCRHYSDVYCEELREADPSPRYFDDSDQRFTFLGMMPARFNRLVLYPGSLLHSACINPSIGICDDPRKGRLTVNTFFDF
ncbi:DUF6445 family protein [Roseateles albus]|uniref:DUF6445 family protein n=1 Tax=Roseateles albus TaxID=2987525 RepID=A0ABT5KH75_9BURK|nr:DUF6445 family protein [Roseateles albus]MDC8773277.1 DUF6445 family protein [Roseateles albus]